MADRDGRPVRRTAAVFSQYKMFLISPWDSSNLIADVGKVIQDNDPSPDTMQISAGLFMNEYIKSE